VLNYDPASLSRVNFTSLRRPNIELRCSRSIPFEQLKKQLRDGNLIEVKLLQDGAPIQMSYFPNPPYRSGIISSLNEFGNLGFAEDYISQDIADFAGHPKNLYTITCTVIRPFEQLHITHPTLVVSLDPLELVSGAVAGAVLLAVALLCALLSLIFGAVFYYLRRRARSPAAQFTA
jgi:hypothetical protein